MEDIQTATACTDKSIIVKPSEGNSDESQSLVNPDDNKYDKSPLLNNPPEDKPNESPSLDKLTVHKPDESSSLDNFCKDKPNESPSLDNPSEDKPNESPSLDNHSEDKPNESPSLEIPSEDKPNERPSLDNPSVDKTNENPSLEIMSVHKSDEGSSLDNSSEEKPNESPSFDNTSEDKSDFNAICKENTDIIRSKSASSDVDVGEGDNPKLNEETKPVLEENNLVSEKGEIEDKIDSVDKRINQTCSNTDENPEAIENFVNEVAVGSSVSPDNSTGSEKISSEETLSESFDNVPMRTSKQSESVNENVSDKLKEKVNLERKDKSVELITDQGSKQKMMNQENCHDGCDKEEISKETNSLPIEQNDFSKGGKKNESLEMAENNLLLRKTESMEKINEPIVEDNMSISQQSTEISVPVTSKENSIIEEDSTKIMSKETKLGKDVADTHGSQVSSFQLTPKENKRRSITRQNVSKNSTAPPQTWYFLSDQKNNDVKGFTLEYYDSTIYMYQNYVNYVTKEIKSGYQLPKYKSELYNNMLARYNASINSSADKSKLTLKESSTPLQNKIIKRKELSVVQVTPKKDSTPVKSTSSITSSKKLTMSDDKTPTVTSRRSVHLSKKNSPSDDEISHGGSPPAKKESAVKTPSKRESAVKTLAVKKESTAKKIDIEFKAKQEAITKRELKTKKETVETKEISPAKKESHPQKKGLSPPKISVRKDILATPQEKEMVSRREKRNSLAMSRELQSYKLPLEKYGWKREVVNRSNGLSHSCDIYYYTPTGKKFRSVREIIEYLPHNSELGAYNFTFIKEPIGLDPPLEVVKDAQARTLVSSDKPKATPGRKSFKTLNEKIIPISPSTEHVSAKEQVMEIKQVNGNVKSDMKNTLVNGTPKRGVKRFLEDEDREEKISTKTHKTCSAILDTKFVKREIASPSPSVLPRAPKSITITPVIHLKTKDKNKSSPSDDSPSPQNENKTVNITNRKNKSLTISTVANKRRKLIVDKEKSPVISFDQAETKPVQKSPPPMKDQNTQTVQVQRSTTNPVLRVVRNNKFLVNDLSNQFNALVHLCKYLRVEDLLRVARVNRLFNAAAHSHVLWHTVRLKNSKIRNWENFSNCLIRHNTHTLDMLKMIGSSDPDENDHIWNQFYRVIGKMHTLRRLELGRVTSTEILNTISNCSKYLAEFSVIAQKSATIDLKLFQGLPNLELLQLKSYESKREYGLIMMNIPILANMRHLRHLSLTGVKNLKSYQINFLKDFPPLETLELGDCTKLDERFPESSLAHLKSLVRLRLEIIHGILANKCIEVIAKLPKLKTIELINIDVKKGFDELFGKLTHIENILIFPTYVTQSSNTNWLVLSGLSKIRNNLKVLTWGFTQELLRVTNLFIEQWNAQKNLEDVLQIDPKEINLPSKESNSIPVLKPLPPFFENSLNEDEQGLVIVGGKEEKKSSISQLDILPIDTLKAMLEKRLINTKVELITVSVALTTRISLPNH